MKKTVIACLLILVFATTYAQQRPKIGLCLSGGGAKGLAHIGLLKVIDSAGIKIDYITGTSMGALLGGLYACGYNGNELEQIARHTNWGMILSNHVPLTDINIEEKDEFGRYLAELPMVGLKPTLPLGAIEGQELNKLLSDLTFHVHRISNFDSLPIPFRCIAADILTGEAVVLKEGYLPTAMRASMAIPSVFTPVRWGEHLLVDGGLVRNFPATDVQEMGATIIIGGYTGGRLFTEEELNSALKLIYQSSSFNRITDSELQKKLCTVLADYDKQLQNYSVGSFRNADSIIDIGYRVALTLYPTLKSLADSLEMAGQKNTDTVHRHYVQQVFISKINIDGAGANNYRLIYGKLALQEGKTYTVQQINNAVNCVYGTRFFDKVYYTLSPAPAGQQLTIHVQESRRAAFKFALHYDNEQAAGIIANLTLRNVAGNGSRVLATLDISEYPKARLHYQKFINKPQSLWVQGGYQYEFSPYRLYNGGRLQEELLNSYNNITAGLNYSFSKKSYAGFFINQEWNYTRTKIYPEDRSSPDSLSFRSLSSVETGLNAIYVKNTLNRFLFPTKGTKILLLVKYVPRFTYTSNYYSLDSTAVNRRFLHTATVNPALKFSASVNHIIPVTHYLSWVNHFFAGFIFDNITTSRRERYSQNAIPGMYFLGGLEQRQRYNTIPLTGYRETELVAAQAILLQTQLQFQLFKKFFLSPTVSAQVTGQTFSSFALNLFRKNFHYQDYSTGANQSLGYGLTFAYTWFGGPLSFTLYRATNVDVWRGYFTFGYKF